MAAEIPKRKYELRKRAATMTTRAAGSPRRRSGCSVGPARTTVSAVAERAGVQRHTVYRHFPTEADLFAACSHLELHPFPDIAPLRGEADPAVRLETALTELYDHYAETAHMWRNILRDVELVPSLPMLWRPSSANSARWSGC